MSVLTVQHLSRTFSRGVSQVHALRDISFTCAEGEFIAICGPSGSGKSTLLNIAGLTEAPTSGSVEFQGKPIDFSNERGLTDLRRTRVGFVFQYFNLLNNLSATENVAMSLLLNGQPWANAQALARETLHHVGLEHRLTHRPEELSGGEMQRVAIARALVHKPALILADEPTGNLDSQAGDSVIRLLRETALSGTTILMATHSERAAQQCTRTLQLFDGALQCDSGLEAQCS